MRKFYKQIISHFLVLILSFISVISTISAETLPVCLGTNSYTAYENGTAITLTEAQPSQNVRIYCKYMNNVLKQRNTVNLKSGEITKEVFNNTETTKKVIKASDNITINREQNVINLFSSDTWYNLGELHIKYNVPTKAVNFKCSYQSSLYGSTTYSINQAFYNVIDLLSELISKGLKLSLPNFIGTLTSAGVEIVGNTIKNGFSGKIAATRTDYVFKAVDLEYNNYTRTFDTSKYVITEVNSKHLNEVYYEDGHSSIHTDNWRKTKLADELMFSFYDCSNYMLIGWY